MRSDTHIPSTPSSRPSRDFRNPSASPLQETRRSTSISGSKCGTPFPDEKVGFSFGVEDPITTAWELQGQGFLTDLFDEPERVKQFLQLTSASIVDVFRFRAELDGIQFPDPSATGMVDDINSFVPAHIFAEFVLPYWEQYHAGITTGIRRAHVEDLRREQLRFLQDVGLSYFDPPISHKLDPPMLRGQMQVPFGWRLGNCHYRDMDEELVHDFLFQAAADGTATTQPSFCPVGETAPTQVWSGMTVCCG